MLMRSLSGDNRILKTLALVLALMTVFAFAPSIDTAQSAGRKLSVQEIVNLLTGDVPSDEVAREARKAGISFQVTPSITRQIKDAGGTDDLIQELRELAPRESPAPTPPPTPHPVPTASPPTLSVISNPGQCQVYVDDEPVGSTSQQGRLRLTQLAAGQHSVRVSLSGYQESEQSVSLEPGRVVTITANLQRIEAPPPTPQPITPPPSPEPVPSPEPARVNNPGYLGVLPAQQQPQGARGVVISGTQPGGPAAQAGLKAYDTILAVNGQHTPSPQELRGMLAAHQVGEIVQITWYDGTQTVTRQIRLSSPPSQPQIPVQPVPTPTPSLRLPHRGVVTFTVAHDHGQSGQVYCTGILAVGNGMIYYKGANSSAGPSGVHNYEIPLDSVKEAHRNAVYLVAIGAFHIRTKRGSNYNFVLLNAQGQYQPPDSVLDAIDNALGK
jgi:hypothetical protein